MQQHVCEGSHLLVLQCVLVDEESRSVWRSQYILMSAIDGVCSGTKCQVQFYVALNKALITSLCVGLHIFICTQCVYERFVMSSLT